MTNEIQNCYIVAAKRTPIGKAPRGVLKNARPDDLLAHAIKAAMAEAPGVNPADIDDAIVGCAMPEGSQGMNVARIGVLLAGLPDTVGGVTINRFCSSGVQAVAMAADRIRLGEADVMIAAGAESMSQVPMMGHKPELNPSIFDDENVSIAYGMGITAENVATQWEISREEQDAFAAKSHEKAFAGIAAGHFTAEMAPYTVEETHPNLATGEIVSKKKTVEVDEGPRAGSTPEGLAKLRPVFRAKGSVTAANSSQMSDGAGAVILVSEKYLKEHNLKPLARFVTSAVAGVPAEIMGIGPKEAIPKALKQAGLKFEDMDWVELNEAFAAQSLAVIKDLNLPTENINPLGGAIALGHPLGATGAIRTATCLHGLKRTGGKYGMVTMCIGTGMGFAAIFENMA